MPPAQLLLFDQPKRPLSAADQGPPTADGGVDEPPQVRISARARRLSLQVMYDGRAELVVPKGTSQLSVERFLAEQRGWLVEARAAQRERHGDVDRTMPAAIDLTAVSEQWRIERRLRGDRPLRVSLRPGGGPSEFVLRLDGDGAIAEDALRTAVRDKLKQRARAMYQSMLPGLARDMQSRYRRLQVRDQNTCWGSFSARGTLSMNYAGLFLEPALVRYLCVHELAHFHHMDHSPAFWACVSRWVPDARAVDRRLGAKHAALPAWLCS